MRIAVPNGFKTNIRRLEPVNAVPWLEALPEQVAALCEQWSLEPDGAVMHGGLSLVVPVKRAGEACVLRVAWPHGETALEVIALQTWGGRGAVRLLEVDYGADALLLERLDATRSLKTLPLEPALWVAGRLLRRLAVPAPADVPLLSAHAVQSSQRFESDWNALGRPFTKQLLEVACSSAVQLAPDAQRLLIHYDLYDDNVLAATREPWLVIDPKVIAGDAEYGVAQMLWRRLEDIPSATQFWRAWEVLLEAAELDAAKARAWTLVRLVDYWLWGLSIGLTIDPARCETIAAWLL